MSSAGAQPFVSVIVPSRDEKARMAHGLQALERRDHPAERRELVLVDVRSTDRSARIVENVAGASWPRATGRGAYAAPLGGHALWRAGRASPKLGPSGGDGR